MASLAILTHMKPCLRLCLTLLISLALPLSGMAGVADSPCPMKMAGMAMVGDMDMGCCDDMGSTVEHGKPCKPGMECQTASVLHVTTVKSALRHSSPLTSIYPDEFLPPQAPSGVWRPPRS